MKTKKMVSFLTACVLLMSLFTVMPASAAENYLTESIGFEADAYESVSTFDGWNIQAKYQTLISGEVTTEKAAQGSKSLKVTVLNNTDTPQITYTGAKREFVAGKEYKLTMKYNIPKEMAGGVVMRFDGVAIPNSTKTSAYVGLGTVTDGWTEFTHTFESLGNTTSISIRVSAGSDVNSFFYVDDLVVNSVEELEAEAIAEAALKFVNVSSYEMFDDFDADCNGWKISNKTDYLTCSAEQKHRGEGSMKVSYPEASASIQIGYSSSRPSVVENTTYEISAWIYVPDASLINSISLFTTVPNKQYVRSASVKPVSGKWFRLSHVFTPNQGNSGILGSLRVDLDINAAATVYIDDFSLVVKNEQVPVLQTMNAIKDTSANDVFVDVDSLSKGAFTVKYDIHKRDDNDGMTDKSLIAAIYKTVGGKKQLVEINVGAFGETDTAVSLPMTGIAASENAADYSMKVMLWDSIAGMRNLKRANISFQ